jgi:hypothetical protein
MKHVIATHVGERRCSEEHDEWNAMRNIRQDLKFTMIAVVLGLMPGIASQASAKPLNERKSESQKLHTPR